MKYIRGTTDFIIEEPTVVTLGKFDGLHRGHEYLLDAMLQEKQTGLSTVVFTFDIPPKNYLDHRQEYVLTTNEEKYQLFQAAGVDYLIECPFTEEFCRLSPYEFLQWLVKTLNVKSIVAGTDFHFGYQRTGDVSTLMHYSKEFGYRVAIKEKMKYDDRDISSTFIREAIANGDIALANRLLGYSYFVYGEVLHGNHLGGPVLGFPTLNLIPEEEKLLPPNGVYITETIVGEERHQGITNIGYKPTIKGTHPKGVESHLFDFDRSVYGENVKVEFLQRIRPEYKFDSLEALKEQIHSDSAYARYYFGNNK